MVNSVTWTQLLANNEVQRHKTSKNELDKLRAVIARDLGDADIDYDDAFVASEIEAAEIVTKAREFVLLVEHWIATTHPSLRV
jgi:hypothetical protein